MGAIGESSALRALDLCVMEVSNLDSEWKKMVVVKNDGCWKLEVYRLVDVGEVGCKVHGLG